MRAKRLILIKLMKKFFYCFNELSSFLLEVVPLLICVKIKKKMLQGFWLY